MSTLSLKNWIQKKNLSRATFIKAFIGIAVLLSSLFGYFYWKKTSVLEVINDIPVVEYTKPPKYVHDIFGDQSMPLKLPLGVLVDSGEVFVSDSDMGVIQVFDYNGKHLRTFGNEEGRGRMSHPYGMAMENGSLYVADGGLGKIMIYDRYGEYQGSVQPIEKGIMVSPAGLFIKDQKIYFTDLALRTVNVMDMKGNVLITFGGRGIDRGQMDYPHAVAVDQNNNIYVADSGNNRVQVFNSSGLFQKMIGGEKQGQIGTPRGLAFDNKGNLYVVSGIENRVHVFNEKGDWIFEFNEVANKDSLSLPNGISIDGHGQIFVTESGASKVALFSYSVVKF